VSARAVGRGEALAKLLRAEGLDAEARRIPYLAVQVDLVWLATALCGWLPIVAWDIVAAEVEEGAPAIAVGVDFYQLVVVDGGKPLGLAPRRELPVGGPLLLRELLAAARDDAGRVAAVLWQPSEGRIAWSKVHRKNVSVMRIDEQAGTATLLVRGRRGREREERGAPLSALSFPRVLVGGDDTHPGRYVEEHTPEGRAELAKYANNVTRPRFSGQVEAHVSRTPIRGAFVVTLSMPGAGESVHVPASEVAHLENPGERYDALAAMAIARSRDMRADAAWAGGPRTRAWTGYVIERSRPPSRRWAEAPALTFAIIAHRRRGRLLWRGLPSRTAAEQRRKELRYKVCEVIPEALADILGRMYDDDPDVEWDADLFDAIDQILDRDGLHGGVGMAALAQHARAWPPAAALYEIVNVMHDPDVEWGVDQAQAIEQILVRYGFVPRPERKQRQRTRRS
jgi:hypothetical protein